MKFKFYLTLLLSFGFCAFSRADAFTDGSRILAECNKEAYSKACFAGMLTYRCANYSTDIYKTGQCLDAARAAADIIDLVSARGDAGIGFVAYSTDVLTLLKDPFTLRYLKAVQEGLEGSHEDSSFDLWDFTYHASRNDAATALRLIAVLFQDTSTDKTHFFWVGNNHEKDVPEEALGRLGRVLDLLEPDKLAQTKASEWLRLYPQLPKKADTHFRANVYHFYAISYLAMRLNWQTHNRRLSAFIPLLLEATYKFRKIAPGRWPLEDPKTLDPEKNRVELNDLYTAYVGARWAVGASGPGTLSYEDFTSQMAANPFGMLQKIYLAQ